MSSEWIAVERLDRVLVLRINRVDKKNALTAAMYTALTTALDHAIERHHEVPHHFIVVGLFGELEQRLHERSMMRFVATVIDVQKQCLARKRAGIAIPTFRERFELSAGIERQDLIHETIVPGLEILIEEQLRRGGGLRSSRFGHATRRRYARNVRDVKRSPHGPPNPVFGIPGSRGMGRPRFQPGLHSLADLELNFASFRY